MEIVKWKLALSETEAEARMSCVANTFIRYQYFELIYTSVPDYFNE